MAKVRAVIEADSGTLLVDFPQGIYALYEKLRSVGIRHSPSNIPIADEEDGAIRVKLYAEDDVGKRLTLLFSEDNTLAEVNTTGTHLSRKIRAAQTEKALANFTKN